MPGRDKPTGRHQDFRRSSHDVIFPKGYYLYGLVWEGGRTNGFEVGLVCNPSGKPPTHTKPHGAAARWTPGTTDIQFGSTSTWGFGIQSIIPFGQLGTDVTSAKHRKVLESLAQNSFERVEQWAELMSKGLRKNYMIVGQTSAVNTVTVTETSPTIQGS